MAFLSLEPHRTPSSQLPFSLPSRLSSHLPSPFLSLQPSPCKARDPEIPSHGASLTRASHHCSSVPFVISLQPITWQRISATPFVSMVGSYRIEELTGIKDHAGYGELGCVCFSGKSRTNFLGKSKTRNPSFFRRIQAAPSSGCDCHQFPVAVSIFLRLSPTSGDCHRYPAAVIDFRQGKPIIITNYSRLHVVGVEALLG